MTQDSPGPKGWGALGLLAALGCQIWPLYFVVTFVLNYIPEVGPFLVCALALPAVLLVVEAVSVVGRDVADEAGVGP